MRVTLLCRISRTYLDSCCSMCIFDEMIEAFFVWIFVSHIAKLPTSCYMFIPFVIPIFFMKLSYTLLAKHIFMCLNQIYGVSLHLCMVSFGDNYGSLGLLVSWRDYWHCKIGLLFHSCLSFVYVLGYELAVWANVPFDYSILFNLQQNHWGKKSKNKQF